MRASSSRLSATVGAGGVTAGPSARRAAYRPRGENAARDRPPLGAWLLATAVVLVSAERAGFRPFRPETWIHWDANIYLSIAREGTTLF